MRNLKALGLALVAMLAMGALAASAAHAEAPAHFTAEEGTADVTALSPEFNQKFTTTAGSVECTGHFEGAVNELTTDELTIDAEYAPCKPFFGVTPVINMGSCHYTFHAGTYGPGAGTSVGSADVVCTNEAEPIRITVPGCTVTVKGGQTVGPIHYQNNGAGGVTVTPEVNNIKYSHTGFLCGTGSGENGTYRGPATVEGTDAEGNPTAVSITST